MNSISWFLYFVDVLGGLAVLAIFLGIAGSVTFVLSAIITMLSRIDYNRYSKLDQDICGTKAEASLQLNIVARRFVKVGAIIGLAFSFLAILIPSHKTMYLMLGSEVGEEVIQSETGQKVQDAINKKLDEYLKDQ